ncbi:DNA repair protein RecA mitochondrial-like, partial [Trifolium pratense]
VRSKISTFGGFGGPTEVTCGGNALKFYSSVRLNIKRIELSIVYNSIAIAYSAISYCIASSLASASSVTLIVHITLF